MDIANFTVEDLIAAKHYWSSMREGVEADLSYEQALQLKDAGLLSAVWLTNKRSKRWMSTWTDEMEKAVKEFLKLYDDPAFIRWWAPGENPDKRTIAEYRQSLVEE